MGLFGKPQTHKITGVFGYVPIRDPRKNKIKTSDLIPSMPGGTRTDDEYLRKYFYQVRNHLSKEIVSEWFQICTTQKDSYEQSLSSEFNSEDFLGFMVQGFAMAVLEYEVFEIYRSDQMADCVWGAMKSFSIQILIESDRQGQENCLSALLSGYHLARTILEINLKKKTSPKILFTASLDEIPIPKQKSRKIKAEPDQLMKEQNTEYFRELGIDPLTERLIFIKNGRFGAYVSDGLTHATLRRGDTQDGMSLQRGSELLAGRREWEANAKK